MNILTTPTQAEPHEPSFEGEGPAADTPIKRGSLPRPWLSWGHEPRVNCGDHRLGGLSRLNIFNTQCQASGRSVMRGNNQKSTSANCCWIWRKAKQVCAAAGTLQTRPTTQLSSENFIPKQKGGETR